jgi:methylthioribose-1-phosphate isomerase
MKLMISVESDTMQSKKELRPVYMEDRKVMMIDQNLLPMHLKIIEIENWHMIVRAIKEMWVRGAPAIGIAGAAGIYLAAREYIHRDKPEFMEHMEIAFKTLAESRPTAVNLFWALKMVRKIYDDQIGNENYHKVNGSHEPKLVAMLRQETERIADEDLKMCIDIGNFGAELISDGDGILTHCNAGGLATGGYGTALGVIRSAHRQGKRIHVFVDETRPRLQGGRLTAWELDQDKIPFTLISDSMAAYFMKKGNIQKAITGADRICGNGDATNKIGTYAVAILCREHRIPFYIAAPFSTFDLDLKSGDDVPIEQRSREEVISIYPPCDFYRKINISNPAFDVTPAEYINAIITEGGILRPPFEASIINTVGLRHGIINTEDRQIGK